MALSSWLQVSVAPLRGIAPPRLLPECLTFRHGQAAQEEEARAASHHHEHPLRPVPLLPPPSASLLLVLLSLMLRLMPCVGGAATTLSPRHARMAAEMATQLAVVFVGSAKI